MVHLQLRRRKSRRRRTKKNLSQPHSTQYFQERSNKKPTKPTQITWLDSASSTAATCRPRPTFSNGRLPSTDADDCHFASQILLSASQSSKLVLRSTHLRIHNCKQPRHLHHGIRFEHGPHQGCTRNTLACRARIATESTRGSATFKLDQNGFSTMKKNDESKKK